MGRSYEIGSLVFSTATEKSSAMALALSDAYWVPIYLFIDPSLSFAWRIIVGRLFKSVHPSTKVLWLFDPATAIPIPKGRPGMFNVSPCLESQGCYLIPFYYLLSALLPTLAGLSFFCFLAHSDCSHIKFFNIFRKEIGVLVWPLCSG